MSSVHLLSRVQSGTPTWRLCDSLGIEISICQRDASRSPERRLDQQHITNIAVELEAKTEEFQGMGISSQAIVGQTGNLLKSNAYYENIDATR